LASTLRTKTRSEGDVEYVRKRKILLQGRRKTLRLETFVKNVEFSSVLGSVLKTSIQNPATDARAHSLHIQFSFPC